MGFLPWIGSHWFPLLQSLAILAALLLSAAALIVDIRVRRVANLIRLTEDHRELWERLVADPQLARVLDQDADLTKVPPAPTEEMFVVFVLLHMSSTFDAMTTGFYRRPEGTAKDIRRFLSFPLPRHVWQKVKNLQDRAFVEFVEDCLSE